MKGKNKPSAKLSVIQGKLLKLRIPAKLIFIVMGLLSTAWFLIRVIPKPSRAAYPCMKATAPFMSAFILYLMGLGGSVLAFRKSRDLLRKARYLAGIALVLVALGSLFAVSTLRPSRSYAREIHEDQEYTPNEPMGIARGIFPGRVVWIHERDVTNDNCTNTVVKDGVTDDKDDVYYQDKNTCQDTVDKMLDAAMIAISGKQTLPEAWDAVFKWFNSTLKGKGEVGYTAGEKVLIKVNRTSSSQGYNSDLSRNDKKNWQNLVETSPQIMLSVLRQLVNNAGVPQEDIYIGDPQRMLYQNDVDKMAAEFPDVHYLGRNSNYGRTPVVGSPSGRLFFSDPTTITEKPSDGLYEIYGQADYLISLPGLKSHDAGGITACTKNHFGSQSENSAYYLHPGLVSYETLRNEYGVYRTLTDVMGSKYLGQNTVICIADAMWCGSNWNAAPNKFITPPFNGEFTSSILVSLDHVAIESVCFDILRSEYKSELGYTDIYPNYGAVDDYLHQAADSANWPEGIIYDPDNSGTPMPSLGVHEHWNSVEQRQYSRNLGTGDGIELVYLDLDSTGGEATAIRVADSEEAKLGLYPNPARDYCQLEFSNPYKGNVNIDMFNATGQLVLSRVFAKETDFFSNTLEVSGLGNGTYVVYARCGKIKITGRLLLR